jgi:hypothetical protein
LRKHDIADLIGVVLNETTCGVVYLVGGLLFKAMPRFFAVSKLAGLISAGVVIPLLTALAWDASATLRGQLAARYDLARGVYCILAVGLPSGYRPEYARLLHERFGVEMSVVAGCVVSEPLLRYVDGYDRLSIAASNRRWRRDIFQESRE